MKEGEGNMILRVKKSFIEVGNMFFSVAVIKQQQQQKDHQWVILTGYDFLKNISYNLNMIFVT